MNHSKIKQFAVCKAFEQQVVILTNTTFNDVESILVATVPKRNKKLLITGLQIPVVLNSEDYFVDLLDIATLSKRYLKLQSDIHLSAFRSEIKAGLDLLVDGF